MQRRSLRLPGRDYNEGTFFVTICAHERGALMGEVIDGEMRTNRFGDIVATTWLCLPIRYSYASIDEWSVMPDHFHGVIVLRPSVESAPDATAVPASATDGVVTVKPRSKTLGSLIGAFKTMSTKEINLLRGTPGARFWERNYWERVVRSYEVDRIREYIRNNAKTYVGAAREPPVTRGGGGPRP